MGTPELLALSLGLSVGVAAAAWLGGRLVERASADPSLRDRVWAVALALPALPPLAVGLLLLTPAPVRDIRIQTPALSATPDLAAAAAIPPPTAGLAFDPGAAAWIVVAVACGLALGRLTVLVLRARRLARLIRGTEAPAPDLVALVASAASDLGVATPRIGVSPSASEALLAGLGRPRLILPADVTGQPAARAMIAHELAHLKRGDHRALWLEETLLALLAVNPLMPLLRRRRAAAREEACDALALAGAGVETRRAYAQSLIEALRSRAGPQATGAMPALTFTGAGRTTAMHRLKAVLNPAAPAGRRVRLAAAAAGLTLLAAVAAGSVAMAAQREPDLRLTETPRADGWGPRFATPREFRVNGQRIDLDFSTLPRFGLQAESIQVAETPAGQAPAWVDYRVALSPGAPALSLEGARLPAGVTADIMMPEFVDRIDRTGDGLNIVLKRDGQASRDPARAPRPLSPDRQARYRGLSAEGFRDVCASGDTMDDGFCSGVMFAQLSAAPDNGVCPPAEVTAGGDNGPALTAFVEGGKRQIARLRPRADEGAYGFAQRALQEAYPCASAARAADRSVATATEKATLRFDVRGERPIRVADGDVLNVWVAGAFDEGVRETRTLSVPLVSGSFEPVSTAVEVPSKNPDSSFVYRAEIVDRDGRKRFETRGPGSVTIRDASAGVPLSLAPAG